MSDSYDLCTLADVKLARRGLPDVLDELVTALIPPASRAIRRFTGRQFIAESAPSDRTFVMGRDPIIPIDDIYNAPTAGAIIDPYGGIALTLSIADDLILLPRTRIDGDPITAVKIRPNVSIWGPGYELSLTGTWGHASVPDDVREACITTVVEWLKNSQGLTPQTPDPFEPGSPPERGLPVKARDLLRPYRHIAVG